MARRRLKNLCLAYLSLLDKGEHAQRQFAEAHNMTDSMAALGALVDNGHPQMEEALEAFYDSWRHDMLVLDKWFTVQARSGMPGTLKRVEQLMAHPDFILTNPNRVRSLIGAFCSANPSGFHRADGAGYRFLADSVLALNSLNPQVAARMLRLMSRWRRYDAPRRELMRSQLERILAAEGVSTDVYEIASKSLEAKG